MRYGFKVGMGALAFVAVAAIAARAQNPQSPAPQAEPNAVGNNVRIDACASDPSRLGLSRIVEIDSSTGPQFGANHGVNGDFLKDGEVILTFDDGPMRHNTRPVLQALADHCTKATFFMVGRMAASDPAMVKEVADAGHTVATHTWSHKNLRANNMQRGQQEFELGVSAVNRALGTQAASFFRFPYLGDNRQIGEYLKSRGVSAWWVDVDSKDYTSRDPKAMQRRVMAGLAVKHKGIILMHDIQPATAHGIKGLLDELHEKGFKVVHIVPKGTVSSVAEYDAIVAKSFKTKAEAAAANPLADRSIVWTAPAHATTPGDGTSSDVQPTGASAQARPAKTSAKPSADLPWVASDAPKPAAKPKSAPATTEALPWIPKTFGY